MAVMPWPIFCGGIMPCGGIGGSWLLPGGLLTPINAKVMALRWSQMVTKPPVKLVACPCFVSQ
jgi:hypothetical protein